MDGDREHLLDSEVPPGEDFPEGFPLNVRHLDTDPFLRWEKLKSGNCLAKLCLCRIQKEEPETWSASVPEGPVLISLFALEFRVNPWAQNP